MGDLCDEEAGVCPVLDVDGSSQLHNSPTAAYRWTRPPS